MPTTLAGELLDRRRVYLCCGVLLALEVAFFAFVIAGTHGLIVPLARPASTDFVSFYAAGSLAAAGTPELAYDKEAHQAAEERAAEPGIDYNFFYYPPTFLLICGALAQLPYLAGFLAFEAGSLVLYLLIARRILGESGWLVLVPLLAFAPLLWTIGLGQNSLLTAALFGAATLSVDRRPALAGMLFGALCYKPHFALLVPLALAAGRHWRALTSAATTVAALSVLSLAVFDWQTWRAYLTAAVDSVGVYSSGRIPFTGYITPFGAVRQLGGTPDIAGAVQLGAMAAAGMLVTLVWARRLSLPIRAASLASAALVAAPLALFYDLMLAAVASFWLLHPDRRNDLGQIEKLALAALFLLSLSPRRMAELLHLPIGPMITLTLAGLVAAAALRAAQRGSAA
jgi:alpha-1,2-mannosyltransferase